MEPSTSFRKLPLTRSIPGQLTFRQNLDFSLRIGYHRTPLPRNYEDVCDRPRPHEDDVNTGLQLTPSPMRPHFRYRARPTSGLSLLELMIVVSIMCIMVAVSIPSLMGMLSSYRVAADARSLAATLRLAQIRAGADFAQAEIVFDTNQANSTYGTYSLQVLNKNASCANPPCWSTEGGTQNLSRTVNFDFGSIGTGAGAGGGNQSGGAPTQTSPIIFNSRGIPVTTGGAATSGYAVYISGPGGLYYAVTADISGKITIWTYQNGGWLVAK